MIHCQGSTSFMMSAVAGLVPEVSTIVSNAVSLHPVVSRLAPAQDGLDPAACREGARLPEPAVGREGRARGSSPRLITAWVKLTHHECDNDVCKLASYTYGVGRPTLWRHENLNAATHDWLTDEFADVPLTFFEQMARCVEAGSLVSVEGRPELPDELHRPAAPDRRPLRLLGRRAERLLSAGEPAADATRGSSARPRVAIRLHVFDRYSHLDVFMGKDAAARHVPGDPRRARKASAR